MALIENANVKSFPFTWVKNPFTIRYTQQSTLRELEDPPEYFTYKFSAIDSSYKAGKMIGNIQNATV